MIQKEFEARRGKVSKEELSQRDQDEKEAARMAKVRAAEFTGKKIPGLEVRQRESYLSLLESSLRSNYDQFINTAADEKDKVSFNTQDILQCSIAEEYKIFTSNKVITMYRRQMAFLMAGLKKETSAWKLHECLKRFDPEKDRKERNEEEEAPKPAFKTALEMAAEKREENPELERIFGNEEKPAKPKKKFTLKRETQTQTSIKSFFNPSSKKPPLKEKLRSVGLDSSDEEAPKNESGLNFYCESGVKEKDESVSSSSPELSDNDNDNDPQQGEQDDEEEVLVLPKLDGSSDSEDEKPPPTELRPQNSVDEKAARLEERIKKAQQRIGEANDQMDYLLKSDESNAKHPKKVKVRVVESGRSKHPPNGQVEVKAPLKQKKPHHHHHYHRRKSPDKKEKLAMADNVIKILVPHFKKGRIASKEVFKFTAREITHVLMKRNEKVDLSKYIEGFLKVSGIVLSEDDAKRKIALYERKL